MANGEATIVTIGGKKINKYVAEPSPPPSALKLYQSFGFEVSRQRTLYVFTSGDAVVIIGFQKPPPGAPANYNDYLDIQSLKVP